MQVQVPVPVHEVQVQVQVQEVQVPVQVQIVLVLVHLIILNSEYRIPSTFPEWKPYATYVHLSKQHRLCLRKKLPGDM